jgi:hypothetical protein
VFPSHRIDHPQFDNSIYLEGWSYVWGSLFGPFYVLYHGFRMSALMMLGFSIAIGGVAAGVILAVAVVMGEASIVVPALVILPIVAVITQGVVAVHLVFLGYLKRGWREGY